MIGQAGGEETEPVLLLHASAGFPFGLDADGSLHLAELPLESPPPGHTGTGPIVFASLDAAVAASLEPVRIPTHAESTALVIVDDWTGHDHALRNFSLLFARHRLLETGFGNVRFLVTDDETPADGWRPELDVVHTRIPLAWPTRAPADAPASPAIGLLLDPASASSEIIDWSIRLHTEKGVRVHVLAGPDGAGAHSLPATFHLIENPAPVWRWLAPRIDLLAGAGLTGWQRRFTELAHGSRVRTIDIASAAGRSQAAQWITGERRVPGPSDTPGGTISLAQWFRALAGGEGGRP